MQRPRCCVRHGAQYAQIQQALLKPQPCRTCGTWRVVKTGVFLPTDSPAWGGTSSQQRVLVYRLCDHCASRLDKGGLPAIEARLRLSVG
jgi:hypothetical protein